MKKMLKTGKKTLSVIMAIMMLMSAWVWVAPTEASAATAGNYKVRITWYNANDKKYSNHFGGTETEQGARAGFILYYKSNNGTGTENKVWWDLGWNNNSGKGAIYGTYVSGSKSTGWTGSSKGTYTCEATIAGFPTAMFGMADSDNFTNTGEYDVTKLEVYSNADSSWKTLWEGTGHTSTTTEYKYWKLTATGTGANGSGATSEAGNDSSHGKVSSTTENWKFPTPTTATTWSGVSAMTCPKTGTATQKVKVIVNDQYGVQMFTPTWSVKGNVCGTTGISVDPATADETTIKLTNAANVASNVDTQIGTITATWGNAGSLSDTFTITDTTYDVKFSYDAVKNETNGAGTFPFKDSANSPTVETKNHFHGDAVTGIPSPQPYYDEDSYYYTFKGWSVDGGINFLSSSQIPVATADKTYTAYYNSVYKPADYTDLDKAIADGKTIQNDAEYTSKYTAASRAILNQALTAFPENYKTKYGVVSQDVIDSFADAINSAISGLTLNTYNVIFLDESNAILEFYTNVQYEGSVSAPPDEDGYYDSQKHYTFAGWTLDKNTDIITDAYNSVKQDLFIYPIYTAEAHNFTKTETVTSTCIQKGATKYICDCGYSYIDGETDYGSHVWPEDYKIDIQPTCSTAGQKSKYCTECGVQGEIVVIPALGHQWGTVSPLAPATCENSGINTRLCDACGVCEHTLVPATGHTYEVKTVAATCTVKGYDEYTCKNCGHSYRDYNVDMLDHNYSTEEILAAPACNIPGVKKLTCDCGHIKTESIPALEHDIGDWVTVVEPTCTGKGYQTKTCSLCGNVIAENTLDALDHNYVTKTVVAPTCTSKGYTLEECDRDGCSAQRVVDEKEALNHAWTSTTHEADCTHGTYIEHICANDSAHNYIEYVSGSTVLPHDFTGTETVISAATCETDGKKTVQCKYCDATTEVILPKLGHAYGDWQVVKEATNSEDGQWKRVCANNAEHVEYITIPKGGHAWDSGTVTEAASCEATGTMVYKCTAHTDCGVTLEVTIPVTQHTVAQKVTAATCTEKGKVEAYCSVCDAECANPFSTTETPVVPHSLDNGTKVEATCTTSGYTLYKCIANDCGFEYKEYNEDEKAKAHTYVATETNAATCTNEGLMTYTCACGASYTERIPATGHSYVENAEKATAATCTELATKTYECSSCDEAYVEHYGTLAAHKFETLVKTVPATNDSLGYEERKCGCGLTQITILEATGTHVFNEKIESECVAPTCTENGTDVYKCTAHDNCDAKTSVVVPRLGHTVTAVYNAPTCIAQGSSEAYCTNCKTTVSSTVIPATGIHDFSGTGVKVDATCTAAGTMTYTCLTDGCNETKVEAIPAKGHDLTTTVTDATCTGKGSVVITCSRCDDPSVEKTYELAAKNHSWNNGEKTVAPTCTTDGTMTYTCTACNDTKTESIPAKGHSWGEWVKTDATTTEDGSWSRTCSNCNDTENLVIPRGHNLVKDTENSKAASCKQEGKEIYICESHTDCGVKIEVTLDKLQHTVAQREIEATCEAEGKVEAYCAVCNDVLSTEEIPVKAHNYVAGEAVAPSCTTSGYTPYTCSCGKTYNVYDASKPATGHSLVEGASTANCTKAGKMTLTCSVCSNYTTTVDVPALGHNYVEDASAATEATCAAPATKTYKCSRCADSYTISVGDKTSEHTWGKETVVEAATATSLGYKTVECSVCGQIKAETIPATGDHEFTVETTDKKDPTCTQDGYIVYACATNHSCGLTSKVTVPATGHKEDLDYKAATCGEAGYARMVCTVDGCNEVLSEEVIPALGHLYGEGTVTNATCTAEGKIEYSCTRTGCGATHEAVIATNSNAHRYKTVVTPATCYKEGSVVTKCALCDDEMTNVDLPMIEHTWNDGEIKQGDAATCTADGKKTYTCTVENCGATKTETISKLGHDWGAWTVTKASTNTEKGEMTRTCSRGCTEKVEIPAGGHNLVVSSSTAATCTAGGSITYTCDTVHEGGVACGITITVTLNKLQHELETTKKDATCTTPGEVVTKCTKCDTLTITTEIPATGHSYTGSVTKAATCTEEGVKTYTCSKCSDSYTEVLPKLQHVYIKSDETAPTCTASGYTTYKCTGNNCTSSYVVITSTAKGHSFDESVAANVTTVAPTCTADGSKTVKCKDCDEKNIVVLPKSGHSYVKVEAVAADCTTAGTEVYTCACGETYTKYIEAAKGHTYGEWEIVTAATADKNGVQKRSCACGDIEYGLISPIGNHNFVEEITKAATCTTEGLKTFTCDAHTNCSANYTETIPAKGHKETLVYTAATCEAAGSTRITCDTCKITIGEETTIPALGHLFNGEGVYKAATCVEKGSMTYTCQRENCNETHVTEIAAAPTAHKFKRTVDDATCKEAGSITVICENDGCNYEEVTTLPMLQHNWGAWTVDTAATNSTDGKMKRVCSNGCEEYCVIPAGGHEFDTTKPASTTAATCKQQGTATYSCSAHTDCGVTITVNTGYAEHTYETKVVESCTANGSVITYCTVCAKEFAKIELGKAQHTYGAGVETAPTCTASGYTTYTCEKCGYSYNEIGADAKGHTLEKTVINGSCTKDGSVVLSCEECDYEVTVDVPALDHDYTKISSTDATCAAAATETYKCSRCDAKYTVSVGDKLTGENAHTWGAWSVVIEATYTTLGCESRVCSVCGKLEVRTVEATGDHSFTNGEIADSKQATCTKNGYITRKCAVHDDCGLTSTEIIAATGHTETAIPAVEATCTAPGSSAGSKCTVCDEVIVAPVTLPALDHAWGNEKVTPASCKEAGKIEYTCTRTGCTATHTVEIPVDGDAHNYITTVHQANCTDDGSVVTKCSLCGDTTTETIPAKGHTFTGAETIVDKATCTLDGLKTIKCASCDATTEVIIPKLGHKMVAGVAVEATCTSSGYTPYTCENDCGESYKVYDATVKEHSYVQVEDSSTATCTDGGTVTLKCTCGDTIEAVVPALGHSYGEWTVINPTAETEGSKTRECGRCHVTETVILPKLGHEMVKDVNASAAPTCTTEGTDVYVCTTHTGDAACGYTYSVTVAAKGHSYGEGVVTEPATCTENGVKTFTCTADGCEAKTTEVIPRTGHTLSTTVNEATCKAAGSVVTKCASCDYSVEKPLEQKPHTISVSYAYPSCSSEGYVKEACDKCDYEKIISTIPALGHSYTGDETVINGATCLEKGEKTVKCSRCDATTTVEIPATGHNYVATETVPATCTESGYILRACDNMDCEASYKELTSNPNGHTWKTTAESETKATCEADGVAVYKCQFCEATNEVITPKFGHSWGEWSITKAPTATDEGEQTRTCIRGGCKETVAIPALGESATYTVKFVVNGEVIYTQTVNYLGSATAPAVADKAPDSKYHYSFGWDRDFSTVTGDLTVNGVYTPVSHTYGEWVVDKTADCRNEGLRHRECDCGYVQQETVAKLAHDFSEILEEKAATCTDNGYKVVVCKNCGDTETQTVKKLGHSMTYYQGYAATCDTDGVASHYSCSRCGKDFEDRAGNKQLTTTVITKKYHTYIVVEGSAATCTNDGVTDYRYCTSCGYTQQPQTIPATGHADVNNDNSCDKCGATYMQGGNIICSCSCHKNGFFNELIYKILSFFWRLFGTNKSCECGKVHY
ncbi:MAG: hypothetical protein E7538_00175 [Ruminococcaceae bacterium]|nr:hypothetical protein [Oscillospiraceae bacterium]